MAKTPCTRKHMKHHSKISSVCCSLVHEKELPFIKFSEPWKMRLRHLGNSVCSLQWKETYVVCVFCPWNVCERCNTSVWFCIVSKCTGRIRIKVVLNWMWYVYVSLASRQVVAFGSSLAQILILHKLLEQPQWELLQWLFTIWKSLWNDFLH